MAWIGIDSLGILCYILGTILVLRGTTLVLQRRFVCSGDARLRYRGQLLFYMGQVPYFGGVLGVDCVDWHALV